MKKRFFCVALSAMMLLPAVPIHAKQNATINKTFITLPKKNSYTLKIKGTKKKVKWSSSKKKVVAVTKSGKVIAKKSGTAYITAKVNGQTLKCEVSVRSHKSITNKLWDAYDWQCEDIWNNGYCDIYHYIEDGTDSCGEKLNIDKTISTLNENYNKRELWNNFVYSIQGKKYSKFKITWKKLDTETVRLKNILDKNGTPAPKNKYYFPYQKYSNYIWKLLDDANNLK